MSLLSRFLGRKSTPQPEPETAAPDPETYDRWLREAFDYHSSGELHRAEDLYRKILDHDPGYPEALYFLALMALEDARELEAIDYLQTAIESRPNDVTFRGLLGGALYRIRQFPEAAQAFRAGVALQPNNREMISGLSAALMECGREEEAKTVMERSIATGLDTPQLLINLAGIWTKRGEIDQSIAAYRRLLKDAPHDLDSRSNLLLTLNYSAEHTAEEILAEHREYAIRAARPYVAPPADLAWPRKLRIGYVSPDLRNHVVAFFVEPILANHDASRFEVFCYYTLKTDDHVTARLRELAAHWRDCADMTDAQLADRIRADRIDILVDLAGHTGHNRLRVFAMKPAPVQATYLGYPNTTGLPAVDYRISDARADPPERDHLSAERLVRLPHCFHCYRPPPEAPEVGPLPALKNGHVTFGCFNNFSKVSAPFLDAAARVLEAVPDSRLWLKARPLAIPDIAGRARRHFERAGIDPSRVDLTAWKGSFQGHLASYQALDIALDTFPYNGTTTTCEALWMGVPVVAIAGDRHAARVGASLLNAVGLDHLVAADVDAFVSICAGLAQETERLSALRSGLRQRVQASPLVDEARFTRDLEHRYVEMWLAHIKAGEAAKPVDDDAVAALLGAAQEHRAAGRHADAAVAYEGILLHQPYHAEALDAVWRISFDAGNPGAAVEWLNRAVAVRPDFAVLHYMLGCSLQAQGKVSDAMSAFLKSVHLDPSFAKGYSNLGWTHDLAGRAQDAKRCYEQALQLDKGLAPAHYNLGNLLRKRGLPSEAAACFREALTLEPAHADWHSNFADICYERLHLDESVSHYRQALELDPALVPAHAGLGLALVALGRPADAEVCFRKALELEPEFSLAGSNLLLCMHYQRGNEPQAMLEEHLHWEKAHARGLGSLAARAEHERRLGGRRLKIGYFSADFQRHPIAHFIAPVLAAHDRTRVHVFCYSAVRHPDDVTGNIRRSCEEWRDVSQLSDDRLAERIRADRIDILVDLAGHTGGGRPAFFARRPAPVQVTWLGYPNTTGLRAMDYRITDPYADPVGRTDAFHTEKLIRLPSGFLCYQPPEECPDPGPAPSSLSRPITFGSFNNLAKITPAMIKLWCRVLERLPQSRLVLKAYGLSAESARRDVVGRFEALGISRERLAILQPDDTAIQHLARYNDIDVALDTFPYNGATTTLEALWMGVPVVTLAGRAHVARVGASILTRAGLGDLVAETEEMYVERALAIAVDEVRRKELRTSMRDRLRASPLIDATAFTHGLEQAYQQMWEDYVKVESEPLRLHIGGTQQMPGWKILNAQSGPIVDFVGDCSDLSQFADESVDEIYASHVLEHLGYAEKLPRTLAEFHRVLKKGGSARISVPDFEVLCRLFLDPRHAMEERFHILRMVFGGQIDPHDFHHFGFTYDIAYLFLNGAGFARIERVDEFALFDDTSSLRFSGVPISLNVIAHK